MQLYKLLHAPSHSRMALSGSSSPSPSSPTDDACVPHVESASYAPAPNGSTDDLLREILTASSDCVGVDQHEARASTKWRGTRRRAGEVDADSRCAC